MNGCINFCLVLAEKKEQGFAKIFSSYDNTDVVITSLLLKAIIIFFRQHCTFKLLECNHTHIQLDFTYVKILKQGKG